MNSSFHLLASINIMTKVAQIEDRGAAVAWSPISEHADVIALGAKVSLAQLQGIV